MKKTSAQILLSLALLALSESCSKNFLEIKPQASLTTELLADKKGLDGLLVAGYNAMDGCTIGETTVAWRSSFVNWLYGEVASDNAHKGSEITDQPEMIPIQYWRDLTADNTYMTTLWRAVYEGVSRANDVLKTLKVATGLSEADVNRIEGEALYLRGYFYFLGKRYFNMIPWIDENTEDFRVPNTTDIWPNIENDFKRAIDLLPEEPAQPGSAHLNAARAGLAKCYMFQSKFSEAKPVLDEIINSGRYILWPNFYDNWNTAYEGKTSGTEAIFQIQNSLNDASGRENGKTLYLSGIAQIQSCCGFNQPSQDLVNAYKTTPEGLPMLDNYNETDLKSDDGLLSSDPFTPATDLLDPRLDHTVGRRGIPYLDFGIFPGKEWVVDQATYGPYRLKKGMSTSAQQAITSVTSRTTVNYNIYRFAHILLMRAECAVEENDLATALDLVNKVRIRARDGEIVKNDDGTPAANYKIEPYPSFSSQDYARKAVRFETRLEMATEGDRWYDLVRWGIAEPTITEYFAKEGAKRALMKASAAYKADYLPIPGAEIELSKDDNGAPTLTQNPNY
ncbi:MAG TPA: RagB/SusD family nutrient uptake outer membrane protein [Flavitalea sp.]|nr:RagB/SusD family nutrient uptake outer membrane protein [Flavitalea sp.]